MVRRLDRGIFWQDDRGISLVESLLVMPIVLLVLVAMIEFGIAVFQWNEATKAVQVGARLAAVSSPITGDVAYDGLVADHTGIPEGNPTPSGFVSVSCGAGTVPCDATRLARLLDGGDGSCQPSGEISMMGMCDFAPFITAENVRITYHRSGLGYVGRPFGPVSTITVELRQLSFDFLFVDELIPGLTSLEIPAQPVSITSEDVSDCRDDCP